MGQQSVLSTLQIQNFAIIDDINLCFDSGFTVFTGETGAGKSIIVDALSLVLGGRSDSTQIRSGCEQCQITATFSCDHSIKQQLQQLDLHTDQDTGQEVIIRRVIGKNGSRCYLNDQQVTLSTLKKTTSRLAAIQGQHAYRTLQDKQQHQQLLDRYAGLDTTKINSAYQSWHDITSKIEKLQEQSGNDSGMELISYQCKELDQAQPTEGEYEQLDQDHRQLAHGEQIAQSCNDISSKLDGDNGMVAIGFAVASELKSMGDIIPEFKSIGEQFNEASITAEEALRELNQQLAKISLEPERLKEVEQRLQTLHELARKHKVPPEQLPQLHQQLKDKLDTYGNLEQKIQELQQQQQQALQEYQKQDDKLHQKRQQAAQKMQQQVAGTLHELGMQHSTMQIQIQQTQKPGPQGSDDIEFYVQINPGSPATPLRKTASGGELSRICLAIHSHTPEQTETGTIIFDEIDTGTGGDAAGKIASLLHSMASNTQVFCITHQAQIAANAQHHYKVEKHSDQTTRVNASKLDHKQREQEIARMLAGSKISKQSREHARAMLGSTTNPQ